MLADRVKVTFLPARVQMSLERAGMYDAVWTLVGPSAVQVTKCDVVLVAAIAIDHRGVA
jgi:hypothetical protein